MKIIKQHSLILTFMLILLGAFSGLIFGWFYANWTVEAIAGELRRTDPNDPLDGLFFISIGITLKSIFIGTLGGIILGTLFYFFVGKEKNLV